MEVCSFLLFNPGYLRSLIHPAAVCDRCVTRIQGEWFRCAYCPKDLCDACEALDTHDDSHVFFIFKAPVGGRIYSLSITADIIAI